MTTAIVKEKIITKIQRLDEYLGNLEIIKKEVKNEKEFIEDFHFYGLAERYLQLASQTVIDILDLIVIEQGFGKPDDRKEIASLLYSKRVISEELAVRIEGLSGFRNILVHEYGEIDKRKVHRYLKNNLSDFDLFKKEILTWIKKNLKTNY